MLYNQRMGTLPNNSQYEQSWENSGPGPASWALGFLRRHYLAIVVTATFTLAASVVFLKVVPPTYMAQAKLLLDAVEVLALPPGT